MNALVTLPRYVEIQRDLEARILSGDWPPGHRVPSEHELVGRYGCSRMTVNKALSALAMAGLVVRRRRSGSFVATPKSAETVLEIHDIQAEVEASGRAYRHEILLRRQRKAGDADARRLGVRRGAAVLALTVRHFAAGRPFVLEDRLIHLVTVPAARAERFTAMPPGTWLLRRIPWTDAEHAIRAVAARGTVAERLGLTPGAACLEIERKTWQGGAPITAVRLVYPGDRHQLIGRFGPNGGSARGANV